MAEQEEPVLIRSHFARLLHVQPVDEAGTLKPRVLIWFDIEGETRKVTIDLADARELVEGTRASLEVHDGQLDCA